MTDEKDLTPKQEINKILKDAEIKKAELLGHYKLELKPQGGPQKLTRAPELPKHETLAHINADSLDAINKTLEKVPKEQQKALRDMAMKSLYPKDDAQKINVEKGQSKNMLVSQDFAMKLKANQIHKEEAKNPGAVQKHDMDASAEYMSKLAGKGMMDRLNKESESKNVQPEKKDAHSMSSKFTQSLKGNENKIPELPKEGQEPKKTFPKISKTINIEPNRE